MPAGDGSWRNLTRSPGVADRNPAWSPDGSRVAWFNDAGGEYGLVVAEQNGANPRRIEIADPSFYFRPEWSPDGAKLAFTDTHYRLLVLDVDSGAVEHVDTDRFAHPERSMNPVWSPDSRWIAYARRLGNQLRAIFVHDTESGTTHQLTDGTADAITPVWDASGKHLYFLASTNYALNTGWLDMTSYDRPVTRALYLALLRADEPSPFLPRSDEEGVGDDDDADEDRDATSTDDSGRDGASADGTAADEAAGNDDAEGSAADGDGDAPDVEIDVAGIDRRIVAAPGLPLRNYAGLLPGPSGTVFVLEVETGATSGTLRKYVVEDREAADFVEPVQAAEVSHDRQRLLYRSGSTWRVVGTEQAPSGNDGTLDLGGMRVRVEPTAEYAQMLRDGWRFMRDFLYVDNQHGAPWDDVWEWYSAWLPDVRHRADFNQLLDMLSGEIAVGHSYVFGGDLPEIDDPRTGLLGADLEVADGFYRIARIYPGDRWTPGAAGPLSLPGLDIAEGDYLLAVDGAALRPPDNPYRLLEGTAGRTIALTVFVVALDGRGPRRPRRARPQREPPAHPGVGHGEPGPRRRAERGPPRLRLAAQHGAGRLRVLQPHVLRAAGPRGCRHRRTQQRRRLGRRLHRRHARPRADRLLQLPCRRPEAVDATDGGALRTQGDDRERERGLGRRPPSLPLPPPRHRSPRGHAHLGRPGRIVGHPTPHRRRVLRRAPRRILRRERRVGGRGGGRDARHRGPQRPRAGHRRPRPAARGGGRGGAAPAGDRGHHPQGRAAPAGALAPARTIARPHRLVGSLRAGPRASPFPRADSWRAQ